MASVPSAFSATALEPAPLLAISEPVVRLLCGNTAQEVAVREACAKRLIDKISGGAATKTHLLRHLKTPFDLPGPNDLYSKVDDARLKVLEALRSAQDDDKENATTVLAAAFCVSKFCLEARDAQLRATTTLANDSFKQKPSVVDEFTAGRLKQYEKMIRNLQSTLNKTLLIHSRLRAPHCLPEARDDALHISLPVVLDHALKSHLEDLGH
jgi:hypothetical protein